ncbi:MAG: T9SS type A sorting domain-containing protein, partial [Rhodobacteraceae bacterium]|nr:T9SS type A sorting domain-containing protein [Paracoccaceae bacterium]
IQRDHLAAGIYMLKVKGENTQQHQKIIINE